jgi:hypothetical protein
VVTVPREPEPLELPDGWRRLEEGFTGSFKLSAKYAYGTDTVEVAEGVVRPAVEVDIMPWKSYDMGGFPDCHQVSLIDRRGEVTSRKRKGQRPSKTEYVEDAKELAVSLMRGFNDREKTERAER